MAEPRSPGGPRPEVTLTPVDFDPFAEPKETVGLPLTEEQAEVWSAAQMGPSASCSFNQCFTVALRGELSVGALEKALQGLVERHEALRARFDPYGSGQTIVDGLRPSLPMKDLSSLPAEERAREVAGIILREGEEPFDLANGPLLRAQLLRTDVDEHRLVFTAHHIVCDGWSSGLLLRDLGALYSAERNGIACRAPRGRVLPGLPAADGDTGGRSEAARGRGLLGQPLRGRRSGRGASPRPATAHGHDLPRGPGERLPSRRVPERAQEARSPPRLHALRHAPRRLPGPRLPAHRADGRGGRNPSRRAGPDRERRPRRALRPHAPAARPRRPRASPSWST